MKYRAYPMVKHVLAGQFAHLERNLAMVFDGAIAFRFCFKRATRQTLTC